MTIRFDNGVFDPSHTIPANSSRKTGNSIGYPKATLMQEGALIGTLNPNARMIIADKFTQATLPPAEINENFETHTFHSFLNNDEREELLNLVMQAQDIEELCRHGLQPVVIDLNERAIFSEKAIENNEDFSHFLIQHHEDIQSGRLKVALAGQYKGKKIPLEILNQITDILIPRILEKLGLGLLLKTQSMEKPDQNQSKTLSINNERIITEDNKALFKLDDDREPHKKFGFNSLQILFFLNRIREYDNRFNETRKEINKEKLIVQQEVTKASQKNNNVKVEINNKEKDKKLMIKEKSATPDAPPVYIVDNTKYPKIS